MLGCRATWPSWNATSRSNSSPGAFSSLRGLSSSIFFGEDAAVGYLPLFPNVDVAVGKLERLGEHGFGVAEAIGIHVIWASSK